MPDNEINSDDLDDLDRVFAHLRVRPYRMARATMPNFWAQVDCNPQPHSIQPLNPQPLREEPEPMPVQLYFQRASAAGSRAARFDPYLSNHRLRMPPSGDYTDWRNSVDADVVLASIRAMLAPRDIVQVTVEDINTYATSVEHIRAVEGGGFEPYDPPALRRCTRCGTRQFEDTEFFARRGTGWSSWCRECHREYARLRRNRVKHGRRFGVEIECILTDSSYYDEPMDPDVIVEAMADAGITLHNNGYTHEVQEDAWKIVNDSSVSSGWEIVSPPLYWKDRDQIRTVCRVIRELGGTADATCGLHVHHEVADLSLAAFKRLYRKWAQWQPYTDQLTSRRRRNGQWSGHIYDGSLRELQQCQSLDELRQHCRYSERYQSLNISCFPTYGTVEVRQHQGTVNARKILAWVAYGQAIIEACTHRVPANIDGSLRMGSFLEFLPFKEDADVYREYLDQRAVVLAGGHIAADDED